MPTVTGEHTIMNSNVTGNTASGIPRNDSRDGIKWVSYCALFISILTFLFGNNITAKLGALIPPQQENKTIIEGIIALLNVTLAIIVLLDIRIFRPVQVYQDNSVASVSFKQLVRGWQLLWLSWIPFYGCLAARWLHLISDAPSSPIWYITNGLNMVNGFFFYYLFFVLDQPSVPTQSKPDRAKSFYRYINITVLLGVVIFIVSEVVARWNPSVNQQSFLVQKLVPAYIAVGMAFFFGRLDSHYLRVHRIILAPLYLYAVIQLFWGRNTFEEPESFNPEQVTIFSLALILKFVIFLTLSRWIRDGKFRQYFIDAKEGLDKNLET
jgi:hypothetical protein